MYIVYLLQLWLRFGDSFDSETLSPQLDHGLPSIAQPAGTTEGTHGVHAPAWVELQRLVPAPAPPWPAPAQFGRE